MKGACAGAVRRMIEDLAAVADAVSLEGRSLESVLEECRRRARKKEKGEEEENEEKKQEVVAAAAAGGKEKKKLETKKTKEK